MNVGSPLPKEMPSVDFTQEEGLMSDMDVGNPLRIVPTSVNTEGSHRKRAL